MYILNNNNSRSNVFSFPLTVLSGINGLIRILNFVFRLHPGRVSKNGCAGAKTR